VAVASAGHMQIICTLLQTYSHASTLPLSIYRPDALPATQPTVSKHWRQFNQFILSVTENLWELSCAGLSYLSDAILVTRPLVWKQWTYVEALHQSVAWPYLFSSSATGFPMKRVLMPLI